MYLVVIEFATILIMAPRFKHNLQSLSKVILKQQKGVPYSEVLGHHSEGLLQYDGTLWSLLPMLIDGERCNAAYNEAMKQNKRWTPEDVERFRSIIGPPCCSHFDPVEFISLLSQIEDKAIYFIDES
jgi:hypothetical protein